MTAVVLGGGIAGLVAARRLARSGPVLLLEQGRYEEAYREFQAAYASSPSSSAAGSPGSSPPGGWPAPGR